ncbi:hypothetical protein ASPACDRAFT_114927 [Aspergillus aculeatus ATCC 16872]|uniref:Uncharacterized protein n=1 Tax=Aspergillus aculeatus (strain ATCC 16872 / CBS 172.66 / WB 5094) TaxID=690307 RepID=A0A1L9X1H4_ASPA1|nr:uncharacterized protein ASPACDRAFT_114927 [Aspergillus aculeatus ATCC 16872]OJK02216.1 hypothetical protein ASPACDRAFT_114927 [Aspergillus aculeatus ATCC 16872]
MTRVEPTITQTTPHGEVEIQTMSGDHLNLVVLRTQDPRFEADDWAPALQLLQEQWKSKRQDEHLECRDQPIGGMICAGSHFRLYIESLTADGNGPARRFVYQGRNEFHEFPPHVQPFVRMPPTVFLEFIRSVRAGGPQRDVSQGKGEGESDTKAGLRLVGFQLDLLECVRLLSLGRFGPEGEEKKEDEEKEVKKEEEDEGEACKGCQCSHSA